MTMIHIENLSDSTDESYLRQLLEKYGKVISMRVMSGSTGRRFDNHALVEMKAAEANKVVSELDGRLFEGAILQVQKATDSQRQQSKPQSAQPKPEPSSTTPDSIRRTFEVTSVEKVDAPAGADGDDWYRYELSHDKSKITGFHRGTLEEVKEFAAESIATLNERKLGGKSTSGYRSAQKK